MIHFTDVTGLAGSTVVLAAAVISLPGMANMPKPHRLLLSCAIIIVALLPVGGLPPAAYLRGVTGDLSITSLVLLVLVILKRLSGWQPLDAKTRYTLLSLVALAALGLYPLALGIGPFDPYRLGYGNRWFIAVLLVAALAAWFRRFPPIAFVIALAVFAWSMNWYESGNLWDYLLDPLISIYAICALTRLGVQILAGRIKTV